MSFDVFDFSPKPAFGLLHLLAKLTSGLVNLLAKPPSTASVASVTICLICARDF